MPEIDARVEIIVPHRSRWDLLERLLDSLDRQTHRPSICVVDNASTDDTLQRLAGREGVRVCPQKENVGFGRAVNVGARTSAAEYLILLNNDMEAEDDFVASMVGRLEGRENMTVGALQLRPDGRIDTIGVSVDQSLIGYDVGRGLQPEQAALVSHRPIGPSGGAAGYRRTEFLAVGGYDERIFAYLEDVDLALRLQARGSRYVFAPEARVWHRHSATLGTGSRAKNELMGWSRGYLLWKYRPALSRSARARGAAIDATVYAGQLALDRNAGSLIGRVRASREVKRLARPVEPPLRGLETVSLTTALRRRFRRGGS